MHEMFVTALSTAEGQWYIGGSGWSIPSFIGVPTSQEMSGGKLYV